MTIYSDDVILKNWPMTKSWYPKKGIDIKYRLIDRSNQEVYATLFGSSQDGITQDDINSELCKMSRSLLSDRARTIKDRPKFKVRNDIKEVIR